MVFLHGLFGQGKNWNTIGKALSESARVMLVDLPNHGQSAWTDHFSYPEMAGRVAGLLKAQGEGEQYAVVGHSMGGKVAMTLALHQPELVERLCVVDVSPVTTAEITDFDTFIHGMRAIDLETLTDRRDADAQLATYVRDPSIRGFLLQNLRRDNSASNGWRWQMNLAMLGDHLDEMSDWPDLEAGRTRARCFGWPARSPPMFSPNTLLRCAPTSRAFSSSRSRELATGCIASSHMCFRRSCVDFCGCERVDVAAWAPHPRAIVAVVVLQRLLRRDRL